MSTKRQIRCAIYTRKSSEEGLEQDFNSLDAQREACEAYIISQKAEGWTALKDRFDDGGYSGGTLERPALHRLLKSMEDGAIDVVVVYKIDRLSRSLMDFSRLVELFDRKSVTFVSVTQSFNTTTSMGRLTLNVLLSFAQFEREVTGERIRDKIAASKRKGIWMGGNPPLGYDVGDRKLVVNQTEADTVRLIFARYLELGCARLLEADLRTRRIVSKLRVLTTGERRGGTSMGRNALYAILNNRVYIGQTTHKGASYKGEHKAIVERSLFEEVQKRLAAASPNLTSKARASQDAPYAGLIVDETGTEMVPSYATKRGGVRYRYYVSRPAMRGERSKATIHRLPAPPFEAFMANLFARLGLSSVSEERSQNVVRRIEIRANSIIVSFDREKALTIWRAADTVAAGMRDKEVIARATCAVAVGETLVEDGDRVVLSLPVRARFRGGRATISYPMGESELAPQPDMALIKALARAHRWRQMLVNGEVWSIEDIANRFGLDRGHAGLTLKLAYLSPALTRAIVKGVQPPGLRLSHLLAADIPLVWKLQQTLLEALPNALAG